MDGFREDRRKECQKQTTGEKVQTKSTVRKESGHKENMADDMPTNKR